MVDDPTSEYGRIVSHSLFFERYLLVFPTTYLNQIEIMDIIWLIFEILTILSGFLYLYGAFNFRRINRSVGSFMST